MLIQIPLPAEARRYFLKEAEQLLAWMRQLTFEQAKELWKCNDRIAEQNYRTFPGNGSGAEI